MSNNLIGLKGAETASGNITNSRVGGSRVNKFALVAQNVGGKATAPKGLQQQQLHQMGDIRSTNNVLDLLCQSPEHMFVVAENGDSNKLFLAPGGSFEEYNGKIVLKANKQMVLMVNKNTGSAAAQKTLSPKDLVPADVSYFRISQPERSSAISIHNTVLDKELALSNAHGSFKEDSNLLLPQAGMKVGNQLKLDVAGRNVGTLVYGGVTNSNSITEIGMFGRKNSAETFDTVNGLVEGANFTIQVDGQTFIMRFKGVSPQTNTGEFNSLETLKDAINRSAKNTLIAQVDKGVLYIGAKNANNDITFADNGAVRFTRELGLTNVAPNADPLIKRFNTKAGAAEILRKLDGVSVSGKDDKIDFTVGRADETAKIHGDAQGWNITSGVFIKKSVEANSIADGIPFDPDTDSRITISSPNHGLEIGNIIKLDLNGAALLGAGGLVLDPGIRYEVVSVNVNTFTINPSGAFADTIAAGALAAAYGHADWDSVPKDTPLPILNAAGLRGGIKWARAIGNNTAGTVAIQRVGNGDPTATINITGATKLYKAGDMVTLQDMDAAGIVVGGHTLINGQLLKIRSVDENSVEIELPGNGATADSPDQSVAAVGGADVYLNQASTMFGALKLNRQKMEWASLYDAGVKTNSGTDRDKWSLAKIASTNDSDLASYEKSHIIKLKEAIQKSNTMEAFNSIGESVKLQILFSVIDKASRKVVYEVRTLKDDNGSFNVATDNEYGVVSSGDLTFDELGNLSSSNTAPISLQFKDSELITLDLNLSDLGNSIRLVNGSQDVKVDIDGSGASEKSSLEIVDNQIQITYRDGKTFAPFALALGTVNNVDHLAQGNSGLFTTSYLSGDLQILNGAATGMPQVLSSVMEFMSDSDVMAAQMDTLEWSRYIQQNAFIDTQKQKQMQELLQKIERVS
jgi:hypothetical protein